MTANEPDPRDSNNSVPLSVDETIEAIRTHRRRFALRWVVETQIPAEVDDIAETLAAIKADDQFDAQDRKREYIALTQHHLDRLDRIGALDYDDQSKTLMPTLATRSLVALIYHIESVCEGGA